MNIEAALVSFALEGHQTTYETSGILFNADVVLLTGTALLPLVQQEKWISLFVSSSSSKLRLNSYIQNVSFRVYIEPRNSSENCGSSTQLYSREAKAAGVWKCPLISLSTRRLFSDWRVGHVSFENKSSDPSRDDSELSRELMSIFILLICEEDGKHWKQRKEANESDYIMRSLLNFLSILRNANRGEEVEVVSTPFGHKHFMNSLSRGVISNAVGCEKCIILSDARTVPGCEGGPIFLAKGSRKEQERGILMGMVICPLTWWRGEWVGLTVGINLLPVVKKLLRPENDVTVPVRNAPDNLSSDSLLFDFIDESVVLVRSKDSWGSGVVLQDTSGIVLTCSHVVKDDEVVSVFHMKNRWFADVIFSSRNDVAYDLAIIKIRHNWGPMKEVKFSEKTPELGEIVIAAGFPFFSEQDDVNIRPSVVTGCISRINSHMIQTTCCVQSGFSGGPLFRDDGKLLGIIVSNALGSGALYPHINFVTPSSVFKEPVLKYIRTKDIRCLKDLESSNVQVQHLWKLQISKL